jgi:hypothetical protein
MVIGDYGFIEDPTIQNLHQADLYGCAALWREGCAFVDPPSILNDVTNIPTFAKSSNGRTLLTMLLGVHILRPIGISHPSRVHL